MKRTLSYPQAKVFLLAFLCIAFIAVGVVAQTKQTKQTTSSPEVLTALRDRDRFRCVETLRSLSKKNPASTRSGLLNALDGGDKPLRLRAAWVLALLPLKTSPPVVQALATHLKTDPDPQLRLCCAIGLMSNKTPKVRDAYIHAANDKSEKVAVIACGELGFGGGTKARATLFTLLSNPSWNVRLEACKALITLKAADARVVSTLEKMAHEPEAKEYDATIERFEKIDKEVSLKYPHEPKIKTWGKLGTILQQARQVTAYKR